jgi:MAGE family.
MRSLHSLAKIRYLPASLHRHVLKLQPNSIQQMTNRTCLVLRRSGCEYYTCKGQDGLTSQKLQGVELISSRSPQIIKMQIWSQGPQNATSHTVTVIRHTTLLIVRHFQLQIQNGSRYTLPEGSKSITIASTVESEPTNSPSIPSGWWWWGNGCSWIWRRCKYGRRWGRRRKERRWPDCKRKLLPKIRCTDRSQDLSRKANDLVRLALFTEHKRTPLRREDISKKGTLYFYLSPLVRWYMTVLGSNPRSFNQVLEAAQKILRNTFGMELVELRSRADLEKAANIPNNEAELDDARTATGVRKKGPSGIFSSHNNILIINFLSQLRQQALKHTYSALCLIRW